MREFQNKVALVTGSSQGIGREIALKLAQGGAFVVVHGNQAMDKAQHVVKEIQQQGGQAGAIQADLSLSEGPATLIERLDALLEHKELTPGLDILVNNAGIVKREPIQDVTLEQFDLTIAVNLRAPFFLIQGLLPRLRDNGRIINMSSMATRSAFPAMASYAPAKAGLEALTRLLAEQLGERGITVNTISPGLTDTRMNNLKDQPDAMAQVAAQIALRRFGQPVDIADAVVLLASEQARWITAQNIEVSGGQRL